MEYKLKNGIVYVLYEGKYWIEDVLYKFYPNLMSKGLHHG